MWSVNVYLWLLKATIEFVWCGGCVCKVISILFLFLFLFYAWVLTILRVFLLPEMIYVKISFASFAQPFQFRPSISSKFYKCLRESALTCWLVRPPASLTHLHNTWTLNKATKWYYFLYSTLFLCNGTAMIYKCTCYFFWKKLNLHTAESYRKLATWHIILFDS